ncbi:hypothetical protein [Marinimicrococcus flavescens]|uniref:Uncharacterized protein n=1 Tax=Marinimicrococcus flavescens TaxID=3031815 RepID=A0AAP3XT87_9PROT|nr:hypothetical protein [Marinimicrococcus flavescens]
MTARPRSTLARARRAALLGLLVLGGCGSYEPFEVHQPEDIKPGPGLLSGSDGRFVLHRGNLPAATTGGTADGKATAR